MTRREALQAWRQHYQRMRDDAEYRDAVLHEAMLRELFGVRYACLRHWSN